MPYIKYLICFLLASMFLTSTYALPSKTVCDNAIPYIDAPNSRIGFGYTVKVQEGELSDAIQNTRSILDLMTSQLSTTAIEALNVSRLVIYHCDPSLESGLKNSYPYDREHYDYLTLLSPKSKCKEFQDSPTTFDGRSWDATVGAGIAPGRIIRDQQGRLACTVSGAGKICDTTTICDANIVSVQGVPHEDPYWEENILVHEFAHTIMNVALPNGSPKEQALHKEINKAYQIYQQSVCQTMPAAYACANADEMWAEASEAWFGATCRIDPQTNTGLTTPAVIKKNIPRLYDILSAVYGPQASIQKIPVYSGKCPTPPSF